MSKKLGVLALHIAIFYSKFQFIDTQIRHFGLNYLIISFWMKLCFVEKFEIADFQPDNIYLKLHSKSI